MKLYFGDNLKVLQSLPDQSVDLIYADPPFNTGKDWGAYDDRWEEGLAGYLNFMRPRVEECKRLLKETGSFYLHCDPTASHYLKVMLDQVFDIENFRNEIVWRPQRPSGGKTSIKNKWVRNHDNIFFYAFKNAVFNKQYETYDKNYISRDTVSNPGYHIGTVWIDILSMQTRSISNKEFLKYPNQKPVALLERIIKASSNEGDVVLDPFAGSGTTLDAAYGLHRKWIGIDEGKQSIETIAFRLADEYGLLPGDEYELHGDTQDINLPTVEDATPQQINLL